MGTQVKAFKNVLMAECKFNEPTASFIQKQGIEEVDSFKNWTTKEMDDAMKAVSSSTPPKVMDEADKSKEAKEQIVITLIGVRDLKILFTWCCSKWLTGTDPDVTDFKGKEATLHNAHQRELVIHKSRAKELAPKLPEKFKTWTKWKPFEDGVITYFKTTRSEGPEGVFLIYLLREHENPTNEMLAADCDTADDFLVECARIGKRNNKVHPGVMSDNKRVFGIIQQLTVGTPGHPHVKKFLKEQDGRKAWLELCKQGDGPAAQHLQLAAAQDSINNSTHTSSNNHSFTQHSAVHAEAHADFERLEEPMPERAKVQAFLDSVSAPHLATHKAICEGDPSKLASCDATQQCLKTMDDKTKKRKGRGVAAVKMGGERPGGGGRGGPNKKPKHRFCSKQEWASMPEAEKEKARKMRADHKKKQEQAKLAKVTATVAANQAPAVSQKAIVAAMKEMAKDSGDDSQDRTITFKLAAAKTQEVVEIVEEDSKPPAKKTPPKNAAAGAQFGRGGSKNEPKDGSKEGSGK